MLRCYLVLLFLAGFLCARSAIAQKFPVKTEAQLVEEYLQYCEKKRIDAIFKLRKESDALKRRLAKLPPPVTEREQQEKERLTKRSEWYRTEIARHEDFSATVHQIPNLSPQTPPCIGELEKRDFGFVRTLLIKKIPDRNHVIVTIFDEHGFGPQERFTIMLQMSSAKLKVGSTVEAKGPYFFDDYRIGDEKIRLGKPANLKPYERRASTIRKAAMTEFQKREKAWEAEQAALREAADAIEKNGAE